MLRLIVEMASYRLIPIGIGLDEDKMFEQLFVYSKMSLNVLINT